MGERRSFIQILKWLYLEKKKKLREESSLTRMFDKEDILSIINCFISTEGNYVYILCV